MAIQVQAPARKPRQGGIKTIVGEFIHEQRLAALPGGAADIAWEDAGCGLTKTTRAGCYDAVTPVADKEPDAVTLHNAIGDPFARYAGVECYLGGDSVGETYEQQARDLLAAGEDRAVETELVDWILLATPAATAPDVVAAIAAAEEHADVNYVGAPVIVMSRFAAEQAFAAGAIVREGGNLVTGNGSLVLATGAFPPANEANVAAIGMPAVWASDIVAHMAIEHTENLAMAIAERVFAIGVDCDYRFLAPYTITP